MEAGSAPHSRASRFWFHHPKRQRSEALDTRPTGTCSSAVLGICPSSRVTCVQQGTLRHTTTSKPFLLARLDDSSPSYLKLSTNAQLFALVLIQLALPSSFPTSFVFAPPSPASAPSLHHHSRGTSDSPVHTHSHLPQTFESLHSLLCSTSLLLTLKLCRLKVAGRKA